MRIIAISVSVCLVSVRSHISKSHEQMSRNILYMLPVTVAWSSSDDNATCYVVPTVAYFQFCRRRHVHVFSERDYVTFAICDRRNSVCGLSVCRLWRWCTLLSRLKFSAIFFSPYDSPGTLVFWCQKSLVGTPLSPWNLCSKWPTPFQTAQFRPISAHSASTVIASEKKFNYHL